MYRKNVLLVCLVTLFSFSLVSAQSDKLKDLEAKRSRYAKELKTINNLLYIDKRKEKSVVTQVEDVNYKIRVRQNLIKITNDQANQLTREINTNQKEITSLRDATKRT